MALDIDALSDLIARRVAHRLREQMRERGISQTEAARRLGVTSGYLGRILKGSRGLSSGRILQISQTFSISLPLLMAEPTPDERD